MWSQLLYIFLLLICPLGLIKGHLIADNQSLETVVYDDVVEHMDEVCASEIGIYYSQHFVMSLAISSQFDLPSDNNASGNVACRILQMAKRVLPCKIDLSIHSSQYLRHLSSYYDSGIYILMRKLII